MAHTKPSRNLSAKANENPLLKTKQNKTKKHKKQRLDFAKDYLKKNTISLENVLWTDENIELLRNAHQQYVYRRQNEVYKEKNILQTVKNP